MYNVRAACRDADGNFGEAKTESYFVGYDEKAGYRNMNVMSVVTDPGNLFDYDTGIYVLGRKYDTELDENGAAAMGERKFLQPRICMGTSGGYPDL